MVLCCVVWLFLCDSFALAHSGYKAGGGKTLALTTFKFVIVIELCCGVLCGVALCCVVLCGVVF